jgi:hypothetical protein
MHIRRARWWVAPAAILIGIVALVDVRVTGPRVSVRWAADVGPQDRAALERKYDLRNGEPDRDTTWRYDLGNRSRDNIRALVYDPAARDTGYINRDTFADRGRDVVVRRRSLPDTVSDGLSLLPRLNSTLWLLLAGCAVLWAAASPDARRRRNVTVAALLWVGVMGLAFPISPSLVRMGDAIQSIQSRRNFENYAAVHVVRFEAHLSYVILDRLDLLYGRTEAAPERAQRMLAHAMTIWFVLCALAIGVLERWSPLVVRYLGLALLAPAALMYFGWREVGYMSLNVAAFPLLARGLRDGSWRLEAGSALHGLGAAMHGYALVGLVGAWIAALATRVRFRDRIGRLLRIAAWGTALYVGWIAIDVIVLKRQIVPGHAEYFPWRPWFTDEILEGRVNAAIFSAIGMRDTALTGWVVGAPLLVVAASLWRQHRDDVRVALAYALSSVFFTLIIWSVQGLNEEMDLIFCRFPAVYALAWVCAHDPKRTKMAAAFLVSAHYVFWRIVLDPGFSNAPIL